MIELTTQRFDHMVYKLNRKTDVFDKASLILHTIITEHPFYDGNKRSGSQNINVL